MFISIVRGSGTIEQGSVEFGLIESFGMSIVLGLFFGGLAGVAQILIEERAYGRMPLHRLLTIRFLFAQVWLFSLVLLTIEQ